MAQDIILFARPVALETYPSTMPYLTALIYNYTDGSKNYHKIKAKVTGDGRVHWSSRAASTVSVRLSKPIVSGWSPANKVEYTYAGTFRWQFEGHKQPGPIMNYKHTKQSPAGWIFSGGNYYSWYQVAEPISNYEQALYYQNRASTTSAMKRAATLWKTIDQEHEDSTAKRLKQQERWRQLGA